MSVDVLIEAVEAEGFGGGGVVAPAFGDVLDWHLDRVYFLTFLNPLRGQPDPAPTARLASLCNRR